MRENEGWEGVWKRGKERQWVVKRGKMSDEKGCERGKKRDKGCAMRENEGWEFVLTSVVASGLPQDFTEYLIQ